MDIFRKITSGVVMVMALLATLGCAGERRNVLPLKRSIASVPPQQSQPATITAHVSDCSEADADGNKITTCYVDFIPVGPDGKYDPKPQTWPHVRVSVISYPDVDGNLTVELVAGSYDVWLWSSHFTRGKTVMGIGVDPGANLSINLDVLAKQ
jgi:hypothetical protein